MQKITLKKEPNYSLKKNAFDFQVRAEDFAKSLEYCGIFHEQGLGKTKIALDVALNWLANMEVDTVIIVTKKGLIHNWEKEISTHTFIKPRILSQNKYSNSFVFNSPTRLILCHYEVFPAEFERLKLFCRTRNIAIILDEAAKIKNPNSTLTKAFFELSNLFVRRVIMTGTPVANRPYDIWALIYFLDNGNALGDDFEKFSKMTNLENSFIDDISGREAFEISISEIFKKIENFCIRETKEGSSISLPKKNFYKIVCDWEYQQRDMYDQVAKEYKLVTYNRGHLTEDISQSILKRLLRLIQITSNPKLVDSSYGQEPGKIEVLRNLVEQITFNNEKVIIWTNFIGNVSYLSKVLASHDPLRIYGKMTIDERNRAVNTFLDDPNRRLLIATPASAKEGLTLTVANHAIFYDRNLSLDDYLQSQDRIHRISQKKEVHVYDLIMRDSIDEWVDSLIESKHFAAQLMQDDITLSEYKQFADYKYGEILKKILREGTDE